MPQVGIDYESNPAGFLAATREVMGASAEALKQFDLNDRGLKRLAVSYLSTSDAAKQASTIQRMAAIQTANEMAASAAQQVASQRVVQTETLRTAEVQEQSGRRMGSAMQVALAAFRPDNLRSFRGELKSTAVEGEGLGRGLAMLGGSLLVTAAAAPLLTHAFAAIQKPAEMLDKAMFGDSERAKELAKQAKATADALVNLYGVSGQTGIKSMVELDTKTKLLTASLADLDAQGRKDFIGGDFLKGADEIGSAKNAANQNAEAIAKLQANEKSLAAQLGDTGAAANDYSRELALVGGNTDLLIGAGPNAIAALAAIGNQANATADSTYGLVSAVSSLLNILGQAGHGSITAGFSTIVGDVVKDAGILANNPLLTQTQASLQKKGLNPDQISAFLAQQKTTLSAIGSGGVGSVGGQAGLYDLNNIVNPQKSGGGGGGGYSAAQAAKDTQSDSLANLRARIQAEQQIHPSSVAYDKQLVIAAQDTLAVARSAEKHAQAVVRHANGEKARHAALQVLHQSQSLVNAAQKDVTRLQDEGKTLALAAKKSALELSNARLEATSNMLDQATADAVHVTEAKAALALDKKNTLDYYRDLKAYNEAVATAASDAASAAQQAKQNQISLANAMIESKIDYSNPLSALQAAVAEARNTLGGTAAGSAEQYQAQAALNLALYNLSQATASNTAATASNTAAMTGVMTGGQVPGYLALRGANSSAFLSPRNGGSHTAPITVQLVVDSKVLAETTVDPMMAAMNGKLIHNPRALLTPTG